MTGLVFKSQALQKDTAQKMQVPLYFLSQGNCWWQFIFPQTSFLHGHTTLYPVIICSKMEPYNYFIIFLAPECLILHMVYVLYFYHYLRVTLYLLSLL